MDQSNDAVFKREHQAKSEILDANEWGPWGKPGPAGKGPTQSQDSPGADTGNGLKA